VFRIIIPAFGRSGNPKKVRREPGSRIKCGMTKGVSPSIGLRIVCWHILRQAQGYLLTKKEAPARCARAGLRGGLSPIKVIERVDIGVDSSVDHRLCRNGRRELSLDL